MTIKNFIEYAIERGWRKGEDVKLDPKYVLVISWSAKRDEESGQLGHGMTLLDMTSLWLDPEAWKAVGKVKGWNSKEKKVIHVSSWPYEEWESKMIGLTIELLKGRTIEQYLETL